MTRFLFVVPPLFGHINPAAGVAAELGLRGHEVAWVGNEELLRRLAGPAARIYGCETITRPRPPELKGPGALRFLWDEFLVPDAESSAPAVHAAIDDFDPQVVISDQQALAGGLIAEARGLPWVTSATTSAELVDPLAGMPKVAVWIDSLISALRGRIAGAPGSDTPDSGWPGTADPRFSPYGVLAFTTRELVGPADLPPSTWLVGPSITARPITTDFPWEWLDRPLPTVLVSLGTANADAGRGFLTEVASAFARMGDRAKAVIVDPAGVLGEVVAPNVLVCGEVPQLSLLPRVDAVLCHAGHNTVCETLWHGLPLVVAPIRDDQPIVAGQVVDAGAGVRLRFGRAGADRIEAAIVAVLTDPSFRLAAETIGESFRAAGGSTTAATRLEQLAQQATVLVTPSRS